MAREVPDYRKSFGIIHESASNGTASKDEMVLKHYVRKEHKMDFLWHQDQSQALKCRQV